MAQFYCNLRLYAGLYRINKKWPNLAKSQKSGEYPAICITTNFRLQGLDCERKPHTFKAHLKENHLVGVALGEYIDAAAGGSELCRVVSGLRF
jgi:hypothetical protein